MGWLLRVIIKGYYKSPLPYIDHLTLAIRMISICDNPSNNPSNNPTDDHPGKTLH